MKLIIGAVIGCVWGLNKIEIKGSKLFDSVTGEQFYIKGIAYQPGGQANGDALADGNACQRDAKYLNELGVNAVRVYGAHPDKNHDACMAALEKEGIYLMLDLSIPEKSIKRDQPRYDIDILKHYTGNVDAFSKYSNLIGFVAGNEVTNDVKTTEASAHVKAVLRDTKAYIAKLGLKIPVGYVDNDDPAIRKNIQDYFNCGTKEERADFYAINSYSWCGASDFEKSGYKDRTNELKDYDIPVLLGEYGCNVAQTRPFNEIESIYGSAMQDVFSGGFVYEYSYEANQYGLVKINGNNVELLNDFKTVKAQLSKANPKKIKSSQYQPTNNPRQCPQVSENWKSNAKLPPTPSEEACQCAYETLSCRVNQAGSLPENGQMVGEQLGYICQYGVCGQVASDYLTGSYGNFSTCDAKVVNSIIFNIAYKDGANCDFKGMAEAVSPTQRNITQCSKASQSEKAKPKPGSKSARKGNSDLPIRPEDVTYQSPGKVTAQSEEQQTPNTQPEDAAYLKPTQTFGQRSSAGASQPVAFKKPRKCRPRNRAY